MTHDEARAALIAWGFQRRQQAEKRDQLVRDALDAGLTKQTVHDLSGIARTTIDRIIGGQVADLLRDAGWPAKARERS